MAYLVICPIADECPREHCPERTAHKMRKWCVDDKPCFMLSGLRLVLQCRTASEDEIVEYVARKLNGEVN